MNTSIDRFQRHLGRLTLGVLTVALAFFGLAILSALLGFPQPVQSFRSAAIAVGYAFGALFAVFLVTSLVMATIRWMDRRSRVKQQSV